MATLKIEGLVSGMPTVFDGEYLVEYDPSLDGLEPGTTRLMNCYLRTTPNIEEALHLDKRQLFDLWKKVDPRQPIRADGKPNRPLTAFTVTIE